MPLSVESLIAIAVGIGLAAASGLRVFLPLLVAGGAARLGALPLSDGFQWLASTEALAALTTASLLEIAAYAIPGVDHLLDLIAAPAAFAAGVVASAAVMVDLPPSVLWPLAIIAGGGAAATAKAATAVVRAKSGLFTGGLANPVVSTAETAGAATLAILAIVIPLVCFALLMFAVVALARRLRRRRTQSHS
jgi:hypothetical protein